MKERDFAIYDKEKKTNIFNHDTLYNLHLCVDHFEWLHDKNSNIPNGFFRPTVEKLTEDEIVVYFAYATDGRFEKFGHEIDGPPRMVKQGPITIDIAKDFFDKIGIQYFKDGDENNYKKHPFDLEAYKKTMYYMPTKYLKEEHKHLSKYYGEEERNN
jgi:hypothetical protein